MDRFVGRSRELAYLEGIYARKGLKTCAVYGRRQIGKSSLLDKFCEGKRFIRFQFYDQSGYDNIFNFRSTVSRFLGREVPDTDLLSEAMGFLADICREEKTVAIFDEYPYLARSAPQAPSIIQKLIDDDLGGTESMIVICGSPMGMMLDEIQRMDRPLYGRFMDRLRVGEMPLSETREFHPGMSAEDALRVHLTVGGVPKYHARMKGKTYKECVISGIISRDAPLADEGPSIISNELDSASACLGIVSRMGGGSAKQSEIADKVGISRAWCKQCLDDLEGLDIVERVHPMLGAPKAPVYRIRDDMVAFHCEVLQRNAATLTGAMSDDMRYMGLKQSMDAFLGKRFEGLCGRYVDANYSVRERGRWWGRARPGDADTDIDIVAKILDDNMTTHTLVCECKFTKRPMGIGDFEELEETAEALRIDNVRYALFSLGGFDRKLMELAEDRGIELVDAERLLRGRSG